MSRRGIALMVTVAMVSGLVVAGGLYQRLVHPRRAHAGPPVTVVVASSTLARGTVLRETHLELATRPRDEVASGAASNVQALLGRIVADQVPTGTPIVESLLVPARHSPVLATAVPLGYRAFGISIDARGGIQQFLQPGNHVDVVVTMEDAEGSTSAKVLLQDVEVLAVSDSAESRVRQGGVESVPVILAVTPRDGEKLSLAMQVGTIQLLVRGYADDQPAQTAGVSKETLLPAAVELIKGQQRRRQQFPDAVPHAAAAPIAEQPS